MGWGCLRRSVLCAHGNSGNFHRFSEGADSPLVQPQRQTNGCRCVVVTAKESRREYIIFVAPSHNCHGAEGTLQNAMMTWGFLFNSPIRRFSVMLKELINFLKRPLAPSVVRHRSHERYFDRIAGLWFEICSTDHNIILYMPRQCYYRDVCKISFCSAEHVTTKGGTKCYWKSDFDRNSVSGTRSRSSIDMTMPVYNRRVPVSHEHVFCCVHHEFVIHIEHIGGCEY